MTQTGKNFLLGLVSLAAVAGMIALLLMFGELDRLFQSSYLVTIECPNAAGVREGSAIELNGVPVGKVDKILNVGGEKNPVQIKALIDHGVVIPADAVPFATASLLGGSATLQLESPGGHAEALPSDGHAHVPGPIRSRLMEDFSSQIDARMGPLVKAMEEFRILAHNLNDLVRPAGPPEGGEAPSIRTAVERLNQVLADFDETLRLAKGWLGDEQLKGDVHAAVNRFNQVMEQGGQTLDEVKRVAQHFETDSHSVATTLVPALDELARTLEQARGMFRRANEGDGTVAQLLNNPDLYRSLEDAAVHLEQVLREAQLALQKIKAEGVHIHF